MGKDGEGIKIVARNRRALHEFHIEEKCEAGLALLGTEVKSLRAGNCDIAQAYARPKGEELFLIDMHIAPYEQGGLLNHEPRRPRKLLLHRRQIDHLISMCTQRGWTIVPLSVYFRRGLAKVEIALARRKRKWEKRRQKEAERLRREATDALKRRRNR